MRCWGSLGRRRREQYPGTSSARSRKRLGRPPNASRNPTPSKRSRTASTPIEKNSERVQKIKQGIVEAQQRIEASEPVQIIKHGITRIETSEPVQIIKHGITRIETSEPVMRLRQRLTSKCENETTDESSEPPPPEGDTSPEVEPVMEPEVSDEPEYQSTLLTSKPLSSWECYSHRLKLFVIQC